MTHTTEKERKDFEAWVKETQKLDDGWWCRQLPDGGYSAGNVDAAWKAWQAARRAQVVPEKESLRECAMCDLSYANGMLAGWNFCVADDDAGFQKARSSRMLEGVNTLKQLAAAPQPPEADHIPDAGNMVAAPVQLPDPDAWRYTDARSHFRYRGRRVGFAAEYPLLKPEPLYTEQQVLAILAQHGIKTT